GRAGSALRVRRPFPRRSGLRPRRRTSAARGGGRRQARAPPARSCAAPGGGCRGRRGGPSRRSRGGARSRARRNWFRRRRPGRGRVSRVEKIRLRRLARAPGPHVSSHRSEPASSGVRMARWQKLVRSLVGKKAIMAVTGLVLFLFVVAHLLGNLKVFEGPAKFDAYAAGLRAIGAPERGERVVRMVER